MTNTILHFGHKGLNHLVAPNAKNINIKTTMKKILLTIAAVAALASCSNEDVLDYSRTEIAFGSAFIENSTRALGDDYSGSKALKQFTLYGTVTGNAATVNLYNAATVRGNVGDATWTCSQTQYWVPNASYKFAAVVDGTVKTADTYGMPLTLGYTVANGGDDLLYAEANAATDAAATPTSGVTDGVVAFTMNHLLSKVYFHITNAAGSDAYSYQVTGITVNNALKEGTYTIPQGSTPEKWEGTGDLDGLSFGTTGELDNGDEADATEDQLIIPAAQTLEVVISYDILFKGTKISETTATKSLTHTFLKNKVYRVGVVLPAPGNPIQFTISTAPAWNGTEVNI